jgi:hypothetical protein
VWKFSEALIRVCVETFDLALNRIQAIAPLTAHEKGVHFWGEHISLKN